MEDLNKNKIIEQILLSLEKFQGRLGYVYGSKEFFSSITKFYEFSEKKLEDFLCNLWQKNIHSALNRNNFMILELKKKYGNISEVKSEYNKLQREFKELNENKNILIKEKVKKYNSLFDRAIENINYIKDNKQKLISEGKKNYLKTFTGYASLITLSYLTIIGFYFRSIVIINKYIVWIVIIWLIILYALWKYLYKWIYK
jgi:hypothetical protein